jgi:hypothetical protein
MLLTRLSAFARKLTLGILRHVMHGPLSRAAPEHHFVTASRGACTEFCAGSGRSLGRADA